MGANTTRRHTLGAEERSTVVVELGMRPTRKTATPGTTFTVFPALIRISGLSGVGGCRADLVQFVGCGDQGTRQFPRGGGIKLLALQRVYVDVKPAPMNAAVRFLVAVDPYGAALGAVEDPM
jgi:hypothetical protein